LKLRILLVVVCALVSATVKSVPCRAQSEVDPDHFEMPNTEPLVQPMNPSTATQRAAEVRGTFTLPFSVTCAGVSLQPGVYSVVVRSLRDRDIVTFTPKGKNAARVQILAMSRSRAEGPSSLILEHRGQRRKLTAVKLERPGITFHLRTKQRNITSSATEFVPIHTALTEGER